MIRNLIDELNTTEKFTKNLLIIGPDEENNRVYSERYPSSTVLQEFDSRILEIYKLKIRLLSKEDRKNFRGVFF